MLLTHEILYEKRLAFMYRLTQKEILNSNIKLCEILLRILIRLKDGHDALTAIYGRVEKLESEEEVMPNRASLRHYLRDLFLYRAKVLGKIIPT